MPDSANLGTVMITGGAKRVGREIAQTLAAKGYTIALHYNHSEAEAQALAAELGAQCNLFQADLQSYNALESLIQDVLKKHPDCHTLINNASLIERISFAETDEAVFDRQMGINFKAPFFLTQFFAQYAKDGNVINILDTAITDHKTSSFAYLLAKKSLHAFTLMAAQELGPRIRVNGICPGIILSANTAEDHYRTKLTPTLPLRKTGEVTEVIDTIQYLMASEYLTGQCIFVDGGESLV